MSAHPELVEGCVLRGYTLHFFTGSSAAAKRIIYRGERLRSRLLHPENRVGDVRRALDDRLACVTITSRRTVGCCADVETALDVRTVAIKLRRRS